MRASGRRRLRRVLVVLWLVGAVVLALIVARSPLFDVDRVETNGIVRTDVVNLMTVSELEVGEPMMDADIAAAEKAIARLPWIYSVDVDRRWPGTVSIEIVERQAAAALPASVGYALVDRFGQVLERVAKVPVGLPVVMVDPGEVPPGDVVESAIGPARTAAAMPQQLWAWVDQVYADAELGVMLELVGEAEVLVGTGSNLDDKFVALSTLLTRVDLACIERIDVRVPTTPVLTRGHSCS